MNLILKRLNTIESSIKKLNVQQSLSAEVKAFIKETIRRQMMFNGTEGATAKKLSEDCIYILEQQYEDK